MSTNALAVQEARKWGRVTVSVVINRKFAGKGTKFEIDGHISPEQADELRRVIECIFGEEWYEHLPDGHPLKK